MFAAMNAAIPFSGRMGGLRRGALALLCLCLLGCRNAPEPPAGSIPVVVFQTPWGPMEAVLFPQTPRHSAQFLRMALASDSLPLHEIASGFTLEGGGPSALPDTGAMAPEPHPLLFHRKGALAANRPAGLANPQRLWNGRAFYFVHGRPYTPEALRQWEQEEQYRALAPLLARLLAQNAHPELAQQAQPLLREGRVRDMADFMMGHKKQLEQAFGPQSVVELTPEQRQAYTAEGGLPELDRHYTVFGQVVAGLQVLDSLALLPTDALHRPETPIFLRLTVRYETPERLQALLPPGLRPLFPAPSNPSNTPLP
jgi:cyclophilin family peptidyl-prolyl cis-trans isomerase